ncbi:hypothetical protein B0T25DRAFT_295067 [Lasiosphaeria hispida]|uniref:Uncharacterized protein n=1 Tax=Lasiosphaeria hispida TaxID=260671 RepID=A0AAJ0HCQ6_9PEZI|nr:hypothetical protein B0T25DRAFT_295067 [Lasiosphaeria hispida]
MTTSLSLAAWAATTAFIWSMITNYLALFFGHSSSGSSFLNNRCFLFRCLVAPPVESALYTPSHCFSPQIQKLPWS